MSLIRVFVIVGVLLVSISCTVKQPYSAYNTPHRFCPGFDLPEWEPDYQPQHNTQELISKQKFAIQPEQHTLWFLSKVNTIGLCIPPKSNFRQALNDCGTVYVVYSRKDEAWELQEQKVTICP